MDTTQPGERGPQEQAIPEFSVIITCYYEEKSIEEFHARLTRSMQSLGRTFEIIFVNDGSTDGTFEKLKRIHEKDPYVSTIVDLFRNAGQVCAMSAGIAHARGRHFIFMDSDLQLDPEELPALVGTFDEGYDIVSGYRKDRHDTLSRRISSKLANMIMRKVSGHSLSDFGCTFKVYHGDLVRAFGFGPYKAWKTAYVFAKAQRVKEIPVAHHRRKYGKSGWTFKKLSMFFFDHIVGISRRPFQLLTFGCFFLAILFVVRILLAWVLPFSVLPVVTPGLLLNFLFIHLLIILGVLAAIGEYVLRNFVSAENDPIYIVRSIFTKARAAESALAESAYHG